jgi:hypothetical protein
LENICANVWTASTVILTEIGVAPQNGAPQLPFYIRYSGQYRRLLLARMLLYVISAGKNSFHHSPYKPPPEDL